MKHIRSAPKGVSPIAASDRFSWQAQGSCADEPLDLFFDGDTAEAKEVCASCPEAIRRTCLDYALTQPENYGIWGGFTEDERATEKRRRIRGSEPRYTPPAPTMPAEPSKSVSPAESVRLLVELFDAGHTAQQIADVSGVSLRALTRLRKPDLPKSIYRATEDKLRDAHEVLLRQEVAA